MKKRLVSIILTVFLVLSMMPFAAFADNAIVCPACGGSVAKQERRLLTAHDDFYKCDKCGKWAWVNKLGSLSLFSVGDQQILDAADSSAIINFSFNNGHLIPAEKVPSGIGRKDLPGYTSDDGTPSVSSDGGIIWQPTWDDVSSSRVLLFYGQTSAFDLLSAPPVDKPFSLTYKKGYSDAVVSLSGSKSNLYINTVYFQDLSVYVPIKGNYVLLQSPAVCFSTLDKWVFYNNKTYSGVYDMGTSIRIPASGKDFDDGVYVKNCYWHIWFPKFKIIPYNSGDKPTSQTNITINNNTWNGNIYTDNSTNLTYIYPQYTTINEKNETVTNISENPIIYNSETKQYYTYDTVTNNYYYITYESSATPTPSPSPSPSPAPTVTPTPSESPAPTPTPDPGENPTLTPTPGGGTTVTPGGDNPGSTSTPESGNKGDSGSSGWNPFKWLTDLLKDLVESILKGIWKLITSIFGFILWLLSLLFKLFPWMPNSGILALCAGVVVVTIIRIIKFITGR